MAIESGRERDLRQAIKAGERAKLKWRSSKGLTLCTEPMRLAYKVRPPRHADAPPPFPGTL